MNQALVHRGPNNQSVYSDSTAYLGHTRLSIIDLSEEGNQPFKDISSRYVMTYNGEVYNYSQVRSELNEFSFQSKTDTEVILYAYIKWGKDCLHKLNGMFAFAIWDTVDQSLFVCRDRLGIKPLYYTISEDFFCFSSEVRPILKSGLIVPKLNHKALSEFLAYQTVHAPDTILQNVKMLLPGHYLEIKSNQITTNKYWNFNSTQENDSYTSVCNNVKQLLYESVERRLVADVPFGAFLSGGIDSSAIVGIMTEVSDRKIDKFSVTFKEKQYTEAQFSQLIAKKFNTNHHEIELSIDDFVGDIEHALDAMDYPSGDGPNSYTVSRATKNAGITMALSGLGGDEVFAGYDVFKRMYKVDNYSLINIIPHAVRKTLGDSLNNLKPGIPSLKIKELLNQEIIDIKNTYPITRQVYFPDELKKILSNYSKHELYKTEINWQQKNRLSLISTLEMQTYMQNVLLRDTDQMSMAHALEVRVPFLDHTLVEYVWNKINIK